MKREKVGAALSPRAALDEAVEAVPGPDLAAALGGVARKLPLAVSVERAAIRLRDSDQEGSFHLVAIEGAGPDDRLAALFDTMTIAQARAYFALGPSHSLGQAAGLRWARGEWLKLNGEPIGAVSVGSRTDRRPTERELALLRAVCGRLAERLARVDRRLETIQHISRQLARDSVVPPVDAPERVRDVLRPRELSVLTLYADGLSAQEIADLFVISTHTVRTHIKNAYRRLGVHSRAQAEEAVHARRVLELL